MKSFGRLMLGVMLVPVFCGLLFAIVYLVLVGLTIPQLPAWAQPGVEAWMMDIPQDSDYYPSEGRRDPVQLHQRSGGPGTRTRMPVTSAASRSGITANRLRSGAILAMTRAIR